MTDLNTPASTRWDEIIPVIQNHPDLLGIGLPKAPHADSADSVSECFAAIYGQAAGSTFSSTMLEARPSSSVHRTAFIWP